MSATPLRVAITRQPDDELVKARASIGGSPDMGYYLTFRGEPEDVLAALRTMLAVAEKALPAGQYKDERGRPQG